MRTGLTAFAGLVMACASAAPPPGGPDDLAAPRLVRVTPDSGAVSMSEKAVTFFFDETINDRGTGAQEIDNYFLVSPSDGLPRVEWHRTRIDVRPRHGFRANTAYTISLLPGLSDLRNNVMKRGASVVFSTGAVIPTTRIVGTAFDWVAERPSATTFLEAVTPDSIRYLAQSDSAGRFVIGPVPEGTYLVRAFVDQNRNRALDRNEAFDSLRVVVPQPSPVELLIAARDTLPARITGVSVTDSVTLRVTFDRLLDPAAPPTAADFRLASGADSAITPITSLLTPAQETAATRATLTAAADSLRKADTTGRAAAAVPAAPTDSVTTAKPSRAAPFNSVALRLARVLAPNAPYRLSTAGVTALSGRRAASERSFTTPKPPARLAADSTAARRPAVSPADSTPPAIRPPVVRPPAARAPAPRRP